MNVITETWETTIQDGSATVVWIRKGRREQLPAVLDWQSGFLFGTMKYVQTRQTQQEVL